MLFFAFQRDKDACAFLTPFVVGRVATMTVDRCLAKEASVAESTEVSIPVCLDVPAKNVDHGS